MRYSWLAVLTLMNTVCHEDSPIHLLVYWLFKWQTIFLLVLPNRNAKHSVNNSPQLVSVENPANSVHKHSLSLLHIHLIVIILPTRTLLRDLLSSGFQSKFCIQFFSLSPWPKHFLLCFSKIRNKIVTDVNHEPHDYVLFFYAFSWPSLF